MESLFPHALGLIATAILVVTLTAQTLKQWRERSTTGIARWFFLGQVSASVFFILYSLSIGSLLFAVTNLLILLSAFAGYLVLRWNRRRALAPRPHEEARRARHARHRGPVRRARAPEGRRARLESRGVTRSRYLDSKLQGLHLVRGERTVLTDVRWRVRPGERWVVLGGNGAGKTQLLKLLAGEVWPAPEPKGTREYLWRGETFRTPEGVREEIAYLGPERQDRYERYDQDFTVATVVVTGLHRTDIPLAPITAVDRRRANDWLEKLGIASLATRRLLTLSYGQRRLVLLARVLATRPALLLLDEAGSGLDTRNRARLDRWLDESTHSRLPWVYTTHREDDVPAAANRLLLLDEGRITYAGEFDRERLEARLQRRPSRAAPKAEGLVSRARQARRAATPVLELERADVFAESVPLLRDIDLHVRAGECWMVHGPNGSGKSTLLRALYGDHAIARPGHVRRFGKPRMSLPEFRAKVGLVAPHLHAQHLQTERALDVVVSGLHASIGLNDAATPAEVRRARRALRELGLDDLRDRTVRELSYGQMRRLLFARAFVGAPRLLLLDEPFAGVDAQTRQILLGVIEAHAAQGLAIVMASHHRNEWPRCATHELQLRRGRAVYRRRGSRNEAGADGRGRARDSLRRHRRGRGGLFLLARVPSRRRCASTGSGDAGDHRWRRCVDSSGHAAGAGARCGCAHRGG